ncbi:hypothetical protein J5N97_009020 [Dioscorea zingiberensis]|uniref:CTLH domain-containing protein n=1 Tax=Dioscorea zingiberensis TaxID=325984 RepID=A0A9D5CVK9_9LILI|nr:hypothetical protein J5N97_009020 [Dioscorea zingiberensis]
MGTSPVQTQILEKSSLSFSTPLFLLNSLSLSLSPLQKAATWSPSFSLSLSLFNLRIYLREILGTATRSQPRSGRSWSFSGMDYSQRRKPYFLGKFLVACVLIVFCIITLKQSSNHHSSSTSVFSRHESGVTHVLVTGGAGYIGSHAALRLLKESYRVTIVDNLSRGNMGAVKVLQEQFPEPGRLQFIFADLGDSKAVNQIFSENAFDAVMHFAAVAYVGESTLEPLRYYHNITANTLVVLEAMAANDVKTLIYSSTCATYGEPKKMPITEATPQHPINPYGKAKKMAEDIILDFSKKSDMAVMILRYFNVIGSDPDGRLGEAPRPELREHGRISGACFDAASGIISGLKVKGRDYQTADGTCVRDYIDVTDLVDAHVKALAKAQPKKVGIYNVGTGKGRSVNEFVEACKKATGVNIKVEYLARRPGDYAEVYSDPSKINRELNWTAQYTDLEKSLQIAWTWQKEHRNDWIVDLVLQGHLYEQYGLGLGAALMFLSASFEALLTVLPDVLKCALLLYSDYLDWIYPQSDCTKALLQLKFICCFSNIYGLILAFMGGVDVDEPPSKRVKVSSVELGGLSNTSSPLEPACPLGGIMARHLPSQGNEDMVGSKGVIKKVEFVRIITKALYSLGYERSGAILEEESGIHMHSAAVHLFRKQVLDGNWDASVATLQKIGLLDDNILKSASFLIFERKFLELVEKDRVMDAINTLRYEITPLSINKKRVHELSSYIISPSQRGLLGFGDLTSKATNSRLELLEELQNLFPPTVMIPERRLEHLVEQALNVQRDACYLHNAFDSSLSLYIDHQCGKDQIPSQTAQVLQAHDNEVWFVQFSNNGRFLASSSYDKTAIVWEVHEDGEVLLKHKLIGHDRPVVMVAWSPDDKQLLTCGLEENVRRWDVNTGNCLRIYGKSGLGLLSCGWFPDGEHFFTGVTDKTICMWDLDGKELECWKGQRTTKTSDMAVTKDGKRIIILCRETAILLLDKEAKLEQLIEEDQIITSFSLSKDDKYLLVNLINQEIHLWSILDDPELIIKYKGHKRSRFLVSSCFGGFEQAFIASGSEDSQVYIWHRNTGDLIWALPGHSGAVNCVSWNPTNLHMLASASDDHTIRIWGLNRVNLKRKEAYSNGRSHHGNGNSKW